MTSADYEKARVWQCLKTIFILLIFAQITALINMQVHGVARGGRPSGFSRMTIDDLRKSRGLHTVTAFGHGPVNIGPCLRV